jgi:hypothetical protein
LPSSPIRCAPFGSVSHHFITELSVYAVFIRWAENLKDFAITNGLRQFIHVSGIAKNNAVTVPN